MDCQPGGCVTCEDGYVKNEDGTCLACPFIDNEDSCKECKPVDRARVFSDNKCLCKLN